ncbi:MAG: leucine-rich repeat protein [Christensenellales bacterium]
MTKIKKALLSVLCCFALIFCSAFVFTACTRADMTAYNITIDEAIQSGWVKVIGDPIAGEEITIVLNPETGYEIVPGSLKVNGEEVVGKTFIMPEGNVNITAKFKKINYAVSTGDVEHGTVDIEIAAHEILSGETTEWGTKVTLTPVPEKGYECTHLEVLNGGLQVLVTKEGDKYSFNMPQGNITINATFEKITYSLTKASEHGTFTIPATANYGDTIEVTGITPDAGYLFSKIKVNGNTISGTTFTMPAQDTTVTVEFKAIEYTVSKINPEHGKITLSKTTANYGDTITVTVTPDAGYTVSAIKVNGTAISGNSFVVTENSEVTVELTANQYSIEVSSSENGSVIPDKTTAIVGELITLTISPDATYNIETLTIKNGDLDIARSVDGNTVTFAMPAGSVTISATFTQTGYRVNVVTCEGGSVIVDPVTAMPGTNVYITWSINEGYDADDGSGVFFGTTPLEIQTDAEENIYFVMPDGEVEVRILFVKETYLINKNSTTNGSYEVSATRGSVGDVINITCTPDAGYELYKITIIPYTTGNPIDLDPGVTSFVMPAERVEVYVSFSKINYTITRTGTSDHGTHGTFEIQDTATYGEEVVITSNPEAGYEATYTVMCGETPIVVTDNKFIMPEGNVTISVSYTPASYTISVDEESFVNGSFTASKTTANYNDEITITVAPDDGYSLKAISVLYNSNGDGIDETLIPAKTEDKNVFVFNMIAYNVKIRAWFGIKNSIIANETTNGTVEITGVTSALDGAFTANATEAFDGDTVTITATPSAGYALRSLKVNNGAVATTLISENVYTFSMPAEAVTLTAEYGVVNITLNTGANGTIMASKLSATEGETITITGTPNSGYYLNEVKIEYGSVVKYANITATNVFEFNMPNENVTITPTFGGFTISNINCTCRVGDIHGLGTINGKRGVLIEKVLCEQTSYIIPDYFVVDGEKLPVLALGISGLSFDDDADWTQNRVPNTVERIDFSDFGAGQGIISLDETYGLNYISTKDNKKWIIGYTRYDMSGTLTLPSGIVGIASGALEDMNNLSRLVCNSDLKYIGSMHNMGSNNETFEVVLNEGLLIIDDEAFNNVPISSINIPSTVQYIGMNAFINCDMLTTVQINSNLTLFEKVSKYHDAVFGTCQNRGNGTYSCSVTTLIIGKDVTELPESLFNQYNLNSITTVIVESGNTTYRVALDDVSGKYALYKGADMILSDLTGNAS